MAHELEINEDGKASMAYTGETPWHGLGTKVPPGLSPEQFLKVAGLDWTVDKVALGGMHKGKFFKSADMSLVRSSDSKELTTISGDWEPVQNIEAFKFFDEFVQAGDMEMETAGSLQGGRMIWALARIKQSFSIFGGDQIDTFFLFSSPHEYGKSVDIRQTMVRVECNNMLTRALAGKRDLSIKVSHRQKFNPEMVKKTLGIASSGMTEYKEIAEQLGSVRYTRENVVEYMKEIFNSKAQKGISRPAAQAIAALDTQPGAKFAEGSWWSAYNAATFTTNHILGHSKESRLHSLWYGQNRDRNIKALNKAVEYSLA